ncbi:MAG: hypothetical protein EOO94_03935 [Pedobacter sp.]|nr:MAG: hypothetical protein EOO94_03935 [Pedobacter sp.]
MLKNRLDSKTYYFIDHDNMMHWKLLNAFDQRTIQYYNLDPLVYKAYKQYYSYPDPEYFAPGWLIVNKTTPVRDEAFYNAFTKIASPVPVTVRISNHEVEAYYINSPAQLSKLSGLFNKSMQ